MADLEAVLADVSYLMAMEKSKSSPGTRAVKRMQLPDPRLVVVLDCSRPNGGSNINLIFIHAYEIMLCFLVFSLT